MTGVNGMKHKEAGFTLIELMIVVSIVAFISAALVPTFGITLQRGRQREAGNLIVQAVYAARSLAARSGRYHCVEVTLGNRADDGGNGGIVAVWRAFQAGRVSCATLPSGFDPAPVWTKSVGGGTYQGLLRAGIVGRDIAISSATQGTNNLAAGNTVRMTFEPTGGMQERQVTVFTVTADSGQVSRFVRVTSGGAVRYGN